MKFQQFRFYRSHQSIHACLYNNVLKKKKQIEVNNNLLVNSNLGSPLLTQEVEKRKTSADNLGTLFVLIQKYFVTLAIPIIFIENIYKQKEYYINNKIYVDATSG